MSQNEKPQEVKVESALPPVVGERAIQLVDDAFRMVRLTKECVVDIARYSEVIGEKATVAKGPAGPNVDAVMVRTALMMLAIHYNMGGTEVVEMARYAAWRLENK